MGYLGALLFYFINSLPYIFSSLCIFCIMGRNNRRNQNQRNQNNQQNSNKTRNTRDEIRQQKLKEEKERVERIKREERILTNTYKLNPNFWPCKLQHKQNCKDKPDCLRCLGEEKEFLSPSPKDK